MTIIRPMRRTDARTAALLISVAMSLASCEQPVHFEQTSGVVRDDSGIGVPGAAVGVEYFCLMPNFVDNASNYSFAAIAQKTITDNEGRFTVTGKNVTGPPILYNCQKRVTVWADDHCADPHQCLIQIARFSEPSNYELHNHPAKTKDPRLVYLNGFLAEGWEAGRGEQTLPAASKSVTFSLPRFGPSVRSQVLKVLAEGNDRAKVSAIEMLRRFRPEELDCELLSAATRAADTAPSLIRRVEEIRASVPRGKL